MFFLTSLITILVASRPALAAGRAFGFAAGTTGGGRAAPIIPSSVAELKKLLQGDTPRVIILDKTYDFTGTEGKATEMGCKPWSCSYNVQFAINEKGWCSSYPNKVTVTYDRAGKYGLLVGSNKTILGKGNSGGLKGKGLWIYQSNNVIIQNIHISDINPKFVWGGDAINVQGATNVWIDHNYFKNIGRMFLVVHSYTKPNTVTISNNYFDGKTPYSTGCDNHHYWAFLFAGNNDKITFAGNYIYYTSGRGPDIGGTAGGKQMLHMYNNYFDDITGHALDAGAGSGVLAEGNAYKNVKAPAVDKSKGNTFAATSPQMAAQCSRYIGRQCVPNSLSTECGRFANSANTAAIAELAQAIPVKKAQIMSAGMVPAYVLRNAGTGK